MLFWNKDTLYNYGIPLIYCLVTIFKRGNGVSSTWPILSEPIWAFSDHLFANINVQIAWRQIARVPNTKNMTPKSEGKKKVFFFFLEAEGTNVLLATYCLNLCWETVTHRTVFRERGWAGCVKSNAFEGFGRRELVESFWMMRTPSRRAQDKLGLAPTLSFPNTKLSLFLPLTCHRSAWSTWSQL